MIAEFPSGAQRVRGARHSTPEGEAHRSNGWARPDTRSCRYVAAARPPGPEREMIDRGPGDLPVRGSVVIPEAELRRRFSRASGPGGQGVNTTDSRVQQR